MSSMQCLPCVQREYQHVKKCEEKICNVKHNRPLIVPPPPPLIALPLKKLKIFSSGSYPGVTISGGGGSYALV